MGKWALNLTFEEGDEVAAQRIESTERLANRLLDLAVTALPVIARASRKAPTPSRPDSLPAGKEGPVTHARNCACNFCQPRPVSETAVEEMIEERLRAYGFSSPTEKAFQDPKAESDKESGC
jgi:hypothetical protein